MNNEISSTDFYKTIPVFIVTGVATHYLFGWSWFTAMWFASLTGFIVLMVGLMISECFLKPIWFWMKRNMTKMKREQRHLGLQERPIYGLGSMSDVVIDKYFVFAGNEEEHFYWCEESEMFTLMLER